MSTTFNRGYNLVPDSGDIPTNVNTVIGQLDTEKYIKRKATTQDTTTGSLVDVADMEFPVGANEEWIFDCLLLTGCDNTGGINVAINGPSGAALVAATIGVGGSPGTGGRGRLTTLNGLSIAYNTYNGADGDIQIRGSITSGVTAGTVKVRFQVVTATQTGTIYAGSTLEANKVS